MELEKALELILVLFSNSSLTLILGAVLCCAATALCKKFLLNKTKIDLLHTFDPTPYLPFVFGCLFAGVCALFSRGEGNIFSALNENAAALVSGILSEGLSVGALSTVVYRVCAGFCSGSIKNLQKDEVFNLLYAQLLSISDAKNRLVSGELTLIQFAGEISRLADEAKSLYADKAIDTDEKLHRLEEMLKDVLGEEVLSEAAVVLHNGLLNAETEKE